jgi:hypothetical protein
MLYNSSSWRRFRYSFEGSQCNDPDGRGFLEPPDGRVVWSEVSKRLYAVDSCGRL